LQGIIDHAVKGVSVVIGLAVCRIRFYVSCDRNGHGYTYCACDSYTNANVYPVRYL